MLFRKLFRMLVLGGAAMGATSGCSTALGQQATEKKADDRGASDGGTATAGDPGGKAAADAGGGVSGW